ncbi:2-polyprenyl-3-methyl-5-hydroxy-6-metoxy-1,4-benzoquinol methylase [Friedmanniella endophytica]|uniref:2-polyprenyl-3-methyl-5-hydroxy-6-metoxy-1, 4-benzoquinol methylase n=1 Tax=Microlunatus kandeliicorticis TaxID=1759536 RepID=A0A7W3IV45_9ACTN|nr:class I SAM-dependent methyltransferase [Microlunatus kandeliicorticis]MBA8795685.1 2-polyprenyl-3-methyl-5-hydroxy-6-metoxy-1,4-benzoquinol methylase [Microlunatus kandeliicorticis]
MVSQQGATFVERLLASRVALATMSCAPVPLRLARGAMLRDNALENAKDSWNRLRAEGERERYAAVREAVERHGADGFVLDIGCSQGILQEGLRYRRYLGVDSFPEAIAIASRKADERTGFVCADGPSFVADRRPDVVVFNEVLYYLPDPLAAVAHHARRLAPGGIVVVSIYARSWASRRLLRQLGQRLRELEHRTVTSGHHAWSVVTYGLAHSQPAWD